jgi:hypothetical protein
MAGLGYGKYVFKQAHIAEYTTAIHIKCEKDDPIKGVQLLTLYEIKDVSGNIGYDEEILIYTHNKPEEPIKILSIDIDITNMCTDVENMYSWTSIKNALDINEENYDILFAVKNDKIIGFLVTLKGECNFGIYKDMHTVHLVCALKGFGSLLIGAYLYCVSFIEGHKYGLLTLMNSIKNASGFFSYSKMGFSPEPDLIKVGCFAQRFCLPMITEIDKDTREEVVKRFIAKKYQENIGMSTHPHFIKHYGAGLNKDQYLKISDQLWTEYDEKCKSLIDRYYIMKSLGVSLEGHYKELIEKLEKLKLLEAMNAFHEISLKSSSPEEISVNEIDKLDDLIKQVDQLIVITKEGLDQSQMHDVQILIKNIEEKAYELYHRLSRSYQYHDRRSRSRSRSPYPYQYEDRQPRSRSAFNSHGGRKKSFVDRKKSFVGRKKSSVGQKKSSVGQKKSSVGQKKSSVGRKNKK